MAKGLMEVENQRGGSWLSMAGGIQEASVSLPGLVLCPCVVGAHPQCHHWQQVPTGEFSSVPSHLWVSAVGDSSSLARHERLFSAVPLEQSFLAVLNSAFVQASASSVSIEQLQVCRFWNLELWSECGIVRERQKGQPPKKHLIFLVFWQNYGGFF